MVEKVIEYNYMAKPRVFQVQLTSTELNTQTTLP